MPVLSSSSVLSSFYDYACPFFFFLSSIKRLCLSFLLHLND